MDTQSKLLENRFFLMMVCVVFLLRSQVRAGNDDELGFIPLFDGKTLNGWRGYDDEAIEMTWVVENGAIRGSGNGPHLATEGVYGDFDLRFLWKVSPGGDSGVYYRVADVQEHPRQSGLEYQILDDQHADQQVGPTTSAGALNGLYGSRDKPIQPTEEFNTARIVVHGTHVEHWMNGTKIVDCEIGSDDWNKKVAASRFHAWPEFSKSDSGRITLESGIGHVWYKQLRIKKLDPKPPK